MIRAAALIACIALAAPAAAQETGSLALPPMPTLKAAVTVTSALVRIGDLVSNAGAAATIPIFRAPDYGTTGTVPVRQVLDAIREHDLLLVDPHGLTEIAVTRAGISIGTREIEQRIARAFAGRQNLGEAKNLVVTLDPDARPILMAPLPSPDLQVARASYDPRTGRFDIVFEPAGAYYGRRVPAYRYTGSLTEMADVAVLTRTVGRGEVLSPSDIAVERRPRAQLPREFLGAADQAVGSALRQTLNAGSPLRASDLTKPELVHRDEPVTIVYQAPGLVLAMRGKAMASGAEGDVIGVMNMQSKRAVQGFVSGPGRVTIPAPTFAAAPSVVASSEPTAQQFAQ